MQKHKHLHNSETKKKKKYPQTKKMEPNILIAIA